MIMCAVIAIAPFEVDAAVLINEIAWMGSHGSAADEWIELRNTGSSAVDLAGWALTDEDSLVIELSGTLGAEAYAVLERTDDDSAPGKAFLIYTGALTNGGATLKLERADGELEDQVAGGADWEAVGGDNETKATAQLTDAGWITASATPGSENATVDIASSEDDTEEEESNETDDEDETDTEEEADTSGEESEEGSSNRSGSNERISLTTPTTELMLEVEEEIDTYVARPVLFRADASGIGNSLIDSLSYTWNFGDGSVGRQKEPTHTYAFPGTYVVVVEAAYARHTARARTVVNVLPITTSLALTDAGDIMIHNDVSYEVDLSGMVLSNGTDTFTLPEYTIVPARGTITLPASRTGLVHVRTVSLTNTNGELVARVPPLEPPAASQENTKVPATRNGNGRGIPAQVPSNASQENETMTEGNATRATTASMSGGGDGESATNTTNMPAAAAAAAGTTGPPLSGRLSLLALLGVIGVGILALYSVRLPD